MTTGAPSPQGAPGPSAPPARHRILLLLAAAVVVINLLTLEKHFIPAHDTKYVFAMFSYFYNQVAAEHELPQWLPLGTFGVKAAAFQPSAFSVSSYFAMMGGAAFGVQDTLCLFKLSMLGEQLLFLLGVYLLSRRLYANPHTVLMIGACAILSTVWYCQVFFNFRIYHLLPLALYFLFRFSDEKRPHFLWLAGLTGLLGALGCPIYLYPMLALIMGLVCLSLGSRFWSALPSLRERSWQNVAAFCAMLSVAAAIGLTLAQALDGLRIQATLRDDSGNVNLESFLTHGGTTTPMILEHFLGAVPPFLPGAEGELTHFVGLLPLLAFLVALPRCRNPHFLALAVPALLLLLLSLGGTFASLAYRLPLMGFFRHVGHLSSVSGLFILLAAGFSIDRLFEKLDAGLDWDRPSRFGALAGITLGLWFIVDLQLGGPRFVRFLIAAKQSSFGADSFAEALSVGVRVLAYLGAAVVVLWPARGIPGRSACGPQLARRALLAAVLVDGLLFQDIALSRMPRTELPIDFRSSGLIYHERRDEPLDPKTTQGLKEWRQSGFPGAEYHLAICSAFQLDPSRPLGRSDLMPAPVADLLEARSELKSDPQLQAVLGSTAPKLRLVRTAVYARDAAEARKLVTQSRSLDTQAVLRGVPEQQQFTPGDKSAANGGTVLVRRFSANRVDADVLVPGPDPAWLVYSDWFHPGWTATVNAKDVPIAEAYLAFKAVRLEPGTNIVHFSFHGGAGALGQRGLALLSILYGMAGLTALLPWKRGVRGEARG